jgi:phosphoribosylglycinamide formyltransferase-1
MVHRLAIFASGNGSNAENIITSFKGNDNVDVALVISNKADALVLNRAKWHGVEAIHFSNADFAQNPQLIIDALNSRNIDIIILAGFMRKVHDDIVKAFPGRILNIHPSLLPAYGGKGMWGHHVHEAVIAAGEKVSGATVHLVTEHIDGGDIILQGHVEVTPDDTPDTLEQKVHKIEYDIYPKAILTLINKQV